MMRLNFSTSSTLSRKSFWRNFYAYTTFNEQFGQVCTLDVRLYAEKLFNEMITHCAPLKYCNCESQWELCFFFLISLHGASLRYFHLFWERRSIIRNSTETTQEHIRLISLHLSHQIVQGRKYFSDKSRPTPQGNHIVQLEWVIW